MTDEPTHLMLEHLKAIRADMTWIKAELQDLKEGQISFREQLHALHGDLLRQERSIAALQLDVGRVKARLTLVDA